MSRFSRLSAELAAKGAHDADALAAYIGRRKYGRAGMKALAAAGRKTTHGGGRSELLGVRAFDLRSLAIEDLTVRSDGDGRTVEAYAAAFNAPAEIHDQDGHYNEILTPGSFDKTIAENGTRFGVLYNHGRTIYGTPDGSLSIPIGVPVEPPKPDSHGVLTVTRYLDNPLADNILNAIKEKAITAQSFSGRFIKSVRTRATNRSGIATIARNEVAMREYGPAMFAAYQQAHIVGTRSAQTWMADLIVMDADERVELFRSMAALAAPLGVTAAAEVNREVITVTPPATPDDPIVRADDAAEATGEQPVSTETSATPVEEPVDVANATPVEGAGTAEEPHTHSARQSDLTQRIRAALIVRGVR